MQACVQIACIAWAVFALALLGCEKGTPAGAVDTAVDTAQTEFGTRARVDCAEFACAEIGSLHAVGVRVEENVSISVPRHHQPEHELEVNGTILAEEVLVRPNVADYVFAPDYDLKTLEVVEDFIRERHHLPGLPSASDVQAAGGALGLAESYRMLLEKVEELTLYAIQQEKRIAAMERTLAERSEGDGHKEHIP
jgi:hypothetical protein